MDRFSYGIACALEEVSPAAPIILRGEMEYLAETAKRLGYETIELQLRDPQRYDGKKLRRIADQAGLRFSAIATGRELVENGLSLVSDDPGVRRAAREKLKLHADLCREIGAMLIVGTMRANVPDPSQYDRCVGLLSEALLELAGYVADRETVIVVENILSSTSNYLNTMRQVSDYVRGLARPNILVHLDTYSMLMEDNDILGAVEYCAPLLKYVHFSDSARLFPGGGNVDFKAFLKALRRVGYRGDVVLECVPEPDALTCAENGLAYLRALEECIRIETSFIR